MSALRYKYCLVPKCNNSTYTNPDKHFFPVPPKPHLRREWFKAIGPGVEYKVFKMRCFCCEDHFDLLEDSNYKKYISGRVKKLTLGKDVLPHKFKCQENFSLPTVDNDTATTNQADGATQTGEEQAAVSETYVVEVEYDTDGSSEYEVVFS